MRRGLRESSQGGCGHESHQVLEAIPLERPIIVDNETFLRTPLTQTAHAACKASLLKLPPKSPDLNPVEKFWAWLRRRLKALDLEDLVKKRPLLGRTAYRERVKRILRTKKAHEVAANCASGLPKVAREVKRRNGASTRG